MIGYNTAIVLAGTTLLGANAGLIGCFALLRRRALLGDTLAHAALPGLCLAFWAVGERNLPVMLGGALASGLVGIAAVALLRRYTRIKDDAALAIVLGVSFGLGFALVRIIQTRVSGGSKAGLDHYIFGTAAGMIADDVKLIAAVSAACLTGVLLLYKEFRLVTFDADFARVQGWPSTWLDFLLMGLVAATVIIALPAGGAVLTAALLILPATAARLWTERLGLMLLLAAIIGGAIGAVGTAVSAVGGRWPTGPVIVLAGAAVFVVSLLFARRRGAVARLLANLAARRKLDEQRLLRAMFKLSNHSPHAASPAVGHDALLAALAGDETKANRLLARTQHAELIEPAGPRAWRLTSRGTERARAIDRASRLWRLFLSDQPESSALFSDLDVESIDRLLPADALAELAEKLGAAEDSPARASAVVQGASP
jgi:manganese/zinc/iron transport system permease protein